MKISIIVPVFNEEKTVEEIINRVKKVKYPHTTEIIVVNDGSTDGTQKILKNIRGIILVDNKHNRGKGFSLRAGFKRAGGDIILIQDADLEYNPQEHLKLLDVLKDPKINVVYGSRFLKKTHKPRYTVFYFGNILLSLLTKILFLKNITDMETCYKAFKKGVIKNVKLTEDRFGFEPEITCKIYKLGFDIVEIPISYNSRSYNEGKKINFIDGLRALYILFKYRFTN